MPHINRIRVNNVKYNFGTQSYDDFVMRLSGKNTIYDLANGGGKSILMLLLLQNMLPNCTLDEKQLIEKLFRANNDNKTIHSLVEWKLDASHVKDGFIYMTTGFCARKAKEYAQTEEEWQYADSASVEYFNYCIFYREFNANDIVNLPLVSEGERVTYQGLKQYLRQLGKKDFSLQIKIFDKKGDYQRFISQYGVYESEWELVRGINKTEGHVRTFFETHYKNARKIVEDLLIEEIIEKSYQNRLEHHESAESIAQTLMDIKDKLAELTRKKSEMEHFDHQIEALRSFQDRLYSLQSLYQEKSDLEKELASTYNALGQRLTMLTKQRDEAEESAAVGQCRLAEIEKEIDRSKIAVEEAYLRDLEQEMAALQTHNRQLEEEANKKERQLQFYEAGNDYFEYLENKKQMEIHKNAILDMTGKNKDLLQEIQALANHLLRIELVAQTKLEHELSELGEKQREKQAACASLQIQMLELDKQQAVLENECDCLSNRLCSLTERLETKRLQSGLVIVEEAKQRAAQLKEQVQTIECDKQAESKGIAELQTQLTALECKQSSDQQQSFSLEEQLQQFQTLFKQREQAGQRMKELETVYEQEGQALALGVQNTLDQRIARLALLQQQWEAKQQRLEHLTKQTIVSDEKAVAPILEYIRRHYDEQAILGAEYLNTLSKQQKRERLEAFPFLCHAIIMQNAVEEAALDEKLRFKAPAQRSVAIVSKEAVMASEELYDSKKMYLLSFDCSYLYSEKERTKEMERCVADSDEIESQIQILKDNIHILRQDLFFIESYLQQKHEQEQWSKQNYEQIKTKYQETLRSLQQFHEKREQLRHHLSERQQSLQQKKLRQEQLAKEIDAFTEINQLYCELVETDNEAQIKKEKCLSIKQEREETAAKLEKERSNLETMTELVATMQRQLAKSKEECKRYQPYQTQNDFPEIALDQSELEQLFLGKEMALQHKNSDVSDKQKMAEFYRTAMEKNQNAIKYRHLTMEELEKKARNHELRIMTIEELEQAKEQAARCKRRLTDALKEQAHKQSQYDRQHGSVRHGIQSYQEKFQEEYNSSWQNESGQTFEQLQLSIKDGKARLKQIKQEAAQQLERVKKIEKQIAKQEAMSRELHRLILNLSINMELYEDCLAQDEDLEQAYEKARGNYDRLAAQERKCRESFEQDKAQLIQTLHLLNATDLATEIGRQFHVPSDAKAALQYRENIKQTVDCISLEKSRIAKSIEHMELMKENFERQCLQICLIVREALQRLSGLSVIWLDQKPTKMLRLSIPYIEESKYQEAIGHYIDKIVETADAMESQSERLRYIRRELAWKQLFSVIVKDMSKIKLYLYKRERMKEQSRYLKYEEAVGSTGQSQGIYIQFLISIINYISCLNGAPEQSHLQKKTIFIDNPFGAAKDVYIWEPIFQLLKSNHVQLIVPARGASPAIVGRFEVNYILGQKLIDGRQQTVVVDYRSQTNTDNFEYQELEFSQSSFDFITDEK